MACVLLKDSEKCLKLVLRKELHALENSLEVTNHSFKRNNQASMAKSKSILSFLQNAYKNNIKFKSDNINTSRF